MIIKSCPFCGEEAVVRVRGLENLCHYVVCEWCGCHGPIGPTDLNKASLNKTEIEAVKNWNNRASIVNPERFDKLEDLI